MFYLRTTVAAVILFHAILYGQEALTRPSCSFSELYKKYGWPIPGLAGAKVKGQRMALKNIPGVFVTFLQPTDVNPQVTDIWCSREHEGRIEIEDRPIRILSLWALDFGGRTFAYELSYGIDVMEDGKRMPIGAAKSLIFYDMDGSGRFVIRKGINSPSVPEMVPDWAKKSGNLDHGGP